MFRTLALILMLGLARPAGDDQVVHLLNRLTYGPRPGEVERVKAIGVQKWIDAQLSPSRIDNAALDDKLTRIVTPPERPMAAQPG